MRSLKPQEAGTVRIRPAVPGDVPRLRDMFTRTVPRVYAGIVSGSHVTQLVLDAMRAVGGAWPMAVVAEVEGVAAGVALVRDENHLSMLWLDEPFRGQGVGSQLLDHVERAVSGAGNDRITLEVYSANAQAVAFYAARGWIVADRFDGKYGAQVSAMEKSFNNKG